MHDPRNDKLSNTILKHSLNLKAGENLFIQGNGMACEPLMRSLIKKAKALGAHPLYRLENLQSQRTWLRDIDKKTLDLARDVDSYLMKKMDAFVGIRAPENTKELSDVSSQNKNSYQAHYYNPVHLEIRVKKTRWVVLRYPTAAFAQSAGMSQEAFEDWFYRVNTLDYSKMASAMQSLKTLMEKSDHVRILGPGETDLRFRIKGIPVIPCAGKRNLPDGEIFTAPIKESVEGVIAYNIPSILDGFEYSNIRFLFKKGKIVEASANDSERLNKVLDIDEGARYIGEFALGLNPHITHPVGDTLFDEKIAASLHFTPGNCYKETFNGNQSALHWDLVLLQEEGVGGGEIWFDDVLIRKNGRFVLSDLKPLNPENLI